MKKIISILCAAMMFMSMQAFSFAESMPDFGNPNVQIIPEDRMVNEEIFFGFAESDTFYSKYLISFDPDFTTFDIHYGTGASNDQSTPFTIGIYHEGDNRLICENNLIAETTAKVWTVNTDLFKKGEKYYLRITGSGTGMGFVRPSISEYTDYMKFLSQYGIFDKDSDSFFPERHLSRAEAAKIAARILYNTSNGLDSEVEYIPPQKEDEYYKRFSDVSPDYWAYPYIYLAANDYNLVDGYDDGTFHPEDEITCGQLIKIAVNMAGYEVYAKNEGGYPLGYLRQAEKLKITNGLEDIEPDAPVTREQAAKIIYNTINAPLMVISDISVNIFGERENNYEILDGNGDTELQTLLTWMRQ